MIAIDQDATELKAIIIATDFPDEPVTLVAEGATGGLQYVAPVITYHPSGRFYALSQPIRNVAPDSAAGEISFRDTEELTITLHKGTTYTKDPAQLGEVITVLLCRKIKFAQ